jgi:twinkle protein
MLVTGSKDDDERRSLDYLSTKFEWMVEELGFCLVLVSHVNDDGKTRGSRNISKIADLWVELIRDKEAATEVERNTTTLMCKKNRFASHTGIFGFLYFDPSTFKVTEMSEGMKEAAPGLEGLPT